VAGVIKALTAAASIGTAAALIQLVPGSGSIHGGKSNLVSDLSPVGRCWEQCLANANHPLFADLVVLVSDSCVEVAVKGG
jgi:hypothetical protein